MAELTTHTWHAAGTAVAEADLAAVIREVVEHVEQSERGPQHSAPSAQSVDDSVSQAQVIADLEVDGIHYTLLRHPSPAPPDDRAPTRLSPREREIIRLIAKGLPNKAIAATLDISLWTVATHLRRTFLKLGVKSRSELVARAFDAGLLPE